MRRAERAPRQLLRYCLVGCANTAVTLGSYALGLALGAPYLAAGVVAFGLGAVNGYVLNRAWTFRARDTWRARTTYLGVQLAAVAANAALLHTLVGSLDTDRLLAQVLALPPVTIATFVANRLVTFRRPATPEGAYTTCSTSATGSETAGSPVVKRISPSSAYAWTTVPSTNRPSSS